jgi:hypothetical protein
MKNERCGAIDLILGGSVRSGRRHGAGTLQQVILHTDIKLDIKSFVHKKCKNKERMVPVLKSKTQ